MSEGERKKKARKLEPEELALVYNEALISEGESDDPSFDDGVFDEDEEDVNPVEIYPWVNAVKQALDAVFGSLGDVVVLSPSAYAELTIANYESMREIMNPSIGTGSFARYFIKYKNGHEGYFLIKHVKSTVWDTEVTAGQIIQTANVTSLFIPALRGVRVQVDGKEQYYVIVPWRANTMTLETFVKNELANRHNIPTIDRINMCVALLKDIALIWDSARLVHLDMKDNHILINITNRQLNLIDFGMCAYDYILNGRRIQAGRSSSKTFEQTFADVIDTTLHYFVIEKPKDNAAIRFWNKQRIALRKSNNVTVFLNVLTVHFQ